MDNTSGLEEKLVTLLHSAEFQIGIILSLLLLLSVVLLALVVNHCSNKIIRMRIATTHRKIIEKAIIKNGINIYAWKSKCRRCYSPTVIYTYNLAYDLRKWNEIISHLEFCDIYLGALPIVDHLVKEKYPH